MSFGKITPQDEAMMDKAIAHAFEMLDKGDVGLAALVSYRDEILALDHNRYAETHDKTKHAEIVVLQQAAQRLDALTEAEKAEVTIYITLEPCLMCLSAISFVGIKRVAYAALNADASEEAWIARGISTEQINPKLVKGELELLPGLRREAGRELLTRMGKAIGQSS